VDGAAVAVAALLLSAKRGFYIPWAHGISSNVKHEASNVIPNVNKWILFPDCRSSYERGETDLSQDYSTIFLFREEIGLSHYTTGKGLEKTRLTGRELRM